MVIIGFFNREGQGRSAAAQRGVLYFPRVLTRAGGRII